MTPAIINYFRKHEGFFPKTGQVVEIGSLNVNGSIRQVFQKPEHVWLGIDRVGGKDVDLVTDAQSFLVQHPNEFDAIVACESYEHDPEWWRTHHAARSALKSGGWFVFSAPTIGFPYHDFGGDYYRFTEDAVRSHLLAEPNFLLTTLDTVGQPPYQCVVAMAMKR